MRYRLLEPLVTVAVLAAAGCGSPETRQPEDEPLAAEQEPADAQPSATKDQRPQARSEPRQASGNRVITNSIRMKLVLIPAGEFMMGSHESVEALEAAFEIWAAPCENEHPLHRVKITKPFWLGMFEVTQGEYQRMMGDNPSRFKGDSRRPVELVSWDDAVEFCHRLSARPAERAAGRVYRLPTEAEWEYACRAGSTGRWCFGDSQSMVKDYAWCGGYGSAYTTHPVGQKRPNAWGLFDMHGNVAEWCSDWYDEQYYRRSPEADPACADPGTDRVDRGGSWTFFPVASRCAARHMNWPHIPQNFIGFRVAMTQ